MDDFFHALSELLGRHHTPLESALDRLNCRVDHLITLVERQLEMGTTLQAAVDAVAAAEDAEHSQVVALSNEISVGLDAVKQKLDAQTALIVDLQAQVAAGQDVTAVVAKLAEKTAEMTGDTTALKAGTDALTAALNPPEPAPAP